MTSGALVAIISVAACVPAESAKTLAPEVTTMTDAQQQRRLEAERLVETFWQRTWNPPHDLDAIDEMMTEDFVITSAGTDVVGRPAFKSWVEGFHRNAGNLQLESLETFANHDATRVVSRWRASAENRGAFGLPSDGRPFSFTGIAIWEVRWGATGPKLAHNWVERSALEAYRSLEPPTTP